MSTQLKLRRGTTTQHSTFTGAEGEITVDTTKDTVVVHDGATAGGFPLAKESGSALSPTSVTLSSGTANGVAYLNGSKVLTTGSALTFDGNNLKVGYALTGIVDSGVSSGVLSASSYLTAHQTSKGIFQFQSDITTIRSYGATAGSGQIAFKVGGGGGSSDSEQMRLTSTGLGIGTSSPGTKLEVSRGTTANASATGATTRSNSALAVAASSDTNTRMMFGINTNANGWVQVQNTSSDITADFIINPVGGNLGLGVTPSAWSLGKSIQIGTAADFSILGYSNGGYLSANAYFNSGWKYTQNNAASQFHIVSGGFQWHTAPSGTAGNAITFTQAMTLDASGNLILGTTSASNAKLRIYGSSNNETRIQLFRGGSVATSLWAEAQELKFGVDGTDGSTWRMSIDAGGNIFGIAGTTGMTNGFFYIPSAGGAPSGTPAAISGHVPMYYDTTNNQFYVYNGAWKKVTLA